MRVVVVEDEVLVRKGIVSGIPWQEHGIEIVGDAADGRTGLELVCALKPDMVITDIQMPIMDGLEMVRRIRKLLPDTVILILSVREDFRAVQDALRLGVMDYVHKLTMSPEELLQSVLQARAARFDAPRSAAMEDGEAKTESFLIEWLEREGAGDSGQPPGFAAAGKAPFAVGVIRLPAEADLAAARRLLGAAAGADYPLAQVQLASPWEAVFWLSAEAEADQTSQEESRFARWTSEWEAALNELAADGIRMAVGLGRPFRRIEERGRALQEAREALRLRFYEGDGRIYVYEPVRDPLKDRTSGEFASSPAIKAYLDALEHADSSLALVRFEQLFPPEIAAPVSPETVRERMMQWQSAVMLLLGEWGLPRQSLQQHAPFDRLYKLDTYAELREWCFRLHTVVREMWEDVAHGDRRSEVEQAIRYIAEHYRKPLRLQEVASSVNLSDNYFSFLFSKSTGRPFVQYVQELRVRKAKELLREGALPWYEVGEQVGFDNPKYFSKIFKRFTDMTPSQFQRNKR